MCVLFLLVISSVVDSSMRCCLPSVFIQPTMLLTSVTGLRHISPANQRVTRGFRYSDMNAFGSFYAPMKRYHTALIACGGFVKRSLAFFRHCRDGDV